MKRFLTSLVVLVALHASAQPYFTINYPTPNQVVTGNTLSIGGAVSGGNLQATMVAYTNGRTDTLSLGTPEPDYPFGYYQMFGGSIPLAGFPLGVPIKLKLTSIDVSGNQKSDSVYFSVTPPSPQAFILQPIEGASAYPSLHVKTNHTGTDTCVSYLSVKINGAITFTDTSVYNDIDTTFNLNSFPSGAVRVVLVVKDKWNHSGNDSIDIFSDSFLYMMPMYTGRGVIKDYNYQRIAEVVEAGNDSMYLTMDSNLQIHKLVPNTRYVTEAYCTPYGVIWDDSFSDLEFTNDSLYTTPPFSSTAGKYVAYREHFTQPAEPFPGNRIMMKNLQTQNMSTIDLIYGEEDFTDPVVAENGTVVYGPWTLNKIIKRNWQTSPSEVTIAQTTGELNTLVSPVTDGKYVLFMFRHTDDNMSWPTVYSYKLLWHNGTSVDTLSDLGLYVDNVPRTPASYTVANGFIAYRKVGQIFLRDTLGVTRQLTFAGNNSINQLNGKGDIIYTAPNGIYYLKHGAASARRIYYNGTLLYRDSSWYVINGRYLYRLNVDAFRTVASGNWTDAASWENGIVPSPNADVIVNTNILLNTNVVCNSLRVVPPGSVTVAPGITVTVLH